MIKNFVIKLLSQTAGEQKIHWLFFFLFAIILRNKKPRKPKFPGHCS